jgi:putative FmdB family regulatory protein
MPLYEYKCKKCGHRFERIQTYSAADATECPVCQGEVERLISAPAAHFKGSGFYSTDYAAKPAASGKSQDGSSGSEGSSAASDKAGGDKGSAAKTESTATPAPSTSTSKSD